LGNGQKLLPFGQYFLPLEGCFAQIEQGNQSEQWETDLLVHQQTFALGGLLLRFYGER